MFTGLIRTCGTVVSCQPFGGGLRLAVDASALTPPPAPGASVAVDGVCLTVTEEKAGRLSFDAVSETARRTTLGRLRPGMAVNLEPALRVGDPLDGHLVQGHVDGVGTLAAVRALPESQVLRITMPAELAPLVAPKGSIAVSGISLTVVEAGPDWFSCSVIPETLKRTTLAALRVGMELNLEADVLARYSARYQACRAEAAPKLTPELLQGF